MRRTPGKLRRIKYPYLTREKKRSINFWDKKCWQHRMSQVVFGYEQWRWDESPEDHFHLVYGVVLENFSELCAVWRAPCCLSWHFSHLSFCACWFCQRNFDMSKPEFDPGGVGQLICQMNTQSSYTSRGCMCSPIVWAGGLKHGSRGNGKKMIKKKTLTWLTACVLFCHATAMQGRRKVGRVSENTEILCLSIN